MDFSSQALEIAESGAGLGIWYHDLQQNEISCTNKSREHFCFEATEPVTYQKLLEAIHHEDREHFDNAVRNAVENCCEFETEFRVVHPDRSLRWLMSKGRVYCDASGKPVRLAGIDMDITDRKQAEEAWLEVQQYLAEAQRRAHIGIAVRVIAENRVIWSDEVYRLWGLEPGSVQPSRERLLEGVHPDDRAMMAEVFRRAQFEGKGATVTFRVVRPDGSVRILRGQGDVVFGKDGRPEKLFGTALDITEQTIAAAELEQSRRAVEQQEDMFKKVVEYSPQAMLLESDGEPYQVLLVNRKFEELLGYNKDDLRVGADWWAKAYPDEKERNEVRAEWRTRVERAFATGRSFEPLESVVTCKDGSKRIIEAHLANIGKLNIITLLDMTQRRNAEAALVRTEKLASAGRMAATVAHEVNNPLEAITNAIYLVSGSPNLSERDCELLSLAQDELKRVAHITRQTLGFHRETGAPVHFSLAALVQEILSLYSSRIASRKIEVIEEFSPETDIHAAPGEMRQVLANLITNAIEAMYSGGKLHVRVHCCGCWGRSTERAVRLTVADTGSGIDPDHLPRIFEPFFTTKQDVGTGLGLWIAHNIVEKHRGSIRVRSCRGKGTVVSLFLPAD